MDPVVNPTTRPAAALPNEYDVVPYTGVAYWFCHPDLIGLTGALHGLATASAKTCRVLELGCGDGGNLLSLAAALPSARLVGVDLSAVQIRMGQALAAEAGLANVTLVHADLTTFEVEPGSFDYVIAHGVYSWVPPAVRDALLRLAARALTPTGVALVSHNTLPGQAPFRAVRELMRMHSAELHDNAKLDAARAIAHEWIALHANDPRRRGTTERVARELARMGPDLFHHDYLAASETPIAFSDFVAHARSHGLDYVDNALPGGQRPELLERPLREMLAPLQDRIRAQQYLDYFEDTRFRVTLLARADAPRGEPLPLTEMAVEIRQPVDRAKLNPLPRVMLETGDGKVEIDDLATRAGLGLLAERAPEVVPLRALRDAILPRLAEHGLTPSPDALLADLGQAFVGLWRHGLVHCWRDVPAGGRARRLEAGALQRAYARRGKYAPDLYHRACELHPDERELLLALDGATDLATLTQRFGPETHARLDALRLRRLI